MRRMIFTPASRYPADPRAVFILALSVFSGITTLLLATGGPPSLEAVLPAWGVLTWGVMLALGSLVTLVGMAFQSVNGIIAEQVGSVTVGAATIFYSGITLWYQGPAAIQSAGIILAWGLACFVRWIQLQILINSALKRQKKQLILDRMHAEIDRRRIEEKLKKKRESRGR